VQAERERGHRQVQEEQEQVGLERQSQVRGKESECAQVRDTAHQCATLRGGQTRRFMLRRGPRACRSRLCVSTYNNLLLPDGDSEHCS
jgi:hypothetical protein